ncbi:MAG: hypothetical protein ACYS8W_13765 [Planctomycetota bacterium]|jgi:hypothetical protein
MKPVHFIIVFIMIVGVVAAAVVIVLPELGKKDANGSEAEIDGLKSQLKNHERKIIELEGKLELMESGQMSSATAMQDLGRKVSGIEKRLGPNSATAMNPVERNGGLEAAALADGNGRPVSETTETELYDRLKEEIKEDLKEDERAKHIERKMKEAEKRRKWMNISHEKKLKNFGRLAQRLQLGPTQEEDIKTIMVLHHEKVMSIMERGWKLQEAGEPDDIAWKDVRKDIGEVYNETSMQLQGIVGEEQAKHIINYIKDNKR